MQHKQKRTKYTPLIVQPRVEDEPHQNCTWIPGRWAYLQNNQSIIWGTANNQCSLATGDSTILNYTPIRGSHYGHWTKTGIQPIAKETVQWYQWFTKTHRPRRRNQYIIRLVTILLRYMQ